MYLPIIALAIAIEAYLVLLVAVCALIFYTRKQNKLIRRQQQKLLEFIQELKSTEIPTATSIEPLPTEKSYRQHLDEQIEATQQYFLQKAPGADIAASLATQAPQEQRILALRYAFLRAEELGTSEPLGSAAFWNIIIQALEPLLSANSTSEAANDELETYKKRIENLEKFKTLFFELEKRWNDTQQQAQTHFDALSSYADTLDDSEHYTQLLEDYRSVYADIGDQLLATGLIVRGQPQENKTINIIRQDPRAAEEIIKLRNVAADQHRVISNLQKQLESANSAEEKIALIESLEQQLQRQIRFVQESDTCVQLLEEELGKAHEQLHHQQQELESGQLLGEENSRIKETLHSFSLESKDMLANIDTLEQENDQLKNSLEASATSIQSETTSIDPEAQEELKTLRKQYAELEERYLELKLK